MKKFEYKTIVIKPTGFWGMKMDSEEIDSALNEMGKQGWELTTVQDGLTASGVTAFYYTFKREI